MRRKINVTASEMLELRKQGMSNHDIAKSLDIAYGTVVRYIGKQGRRMEGLEAFKDAPTPKKEDAKAEVKPVIPKYDPKPTLERYRVSGIMIYMNSIDRYVTISGEEGEIILEYESIPDLVQFLAWAMRERMEVKADAEADKQQAEGCEV